MSSFFAKYKHFLPPAAPFFSTLSAYNYIFSISYMEQEKVFNIVYKLSPPHCIKPTPSGHSTSFCPIFSSRLTYFTLFSMNNAFFLHFEIFYKILDKCFLLIYFPLSIYLERTIFGGTSSEFQSVCFNANPV